MTFLMIGSTPGRRRGAGRLLASVAVLLVALAAWFVTVERIEGIGVSPAALVEEASAEGGGRRAPMLSVPPWPALLPAGARAPASGSP